MAWKDGRRSRWWCESRDQRDLELLAVDPTTGARRACSSTSTTTPGSTSTRRVPRWLPDGSAFLWSSERVGALAARSCASATGALARRSSQPTDGYASSRTSTPRPRGVVSRRARPDRGAPRIACALDGGARRARDRERRACTTPAFAHAIAVVSCCARRRPTRCRASAAHAATDDERRARRGELPSVAEAPPFRADAELTRVGEDELSRRDRRGRATSIPSSSYPVIVDVYGGPAPPAGDAARWRRCCCGSGSPITASSWSPSTGAARRGAGARGSARIAGNFAGVTARRSGDRAARARRQISRSSICRASASSAGRSAATCRRWRCSSAPTCSPSPSPARRWSTGATTTPLYTERYLGTARRTTPTATTQSSLLTYAAELAAPAAHRARHARRQRLLLPLAQAVRRAVPRRQAVRAPAAARA